MPIANPVQRKSLNRLAFDHYLRTGERLTNAEWLARHERKFNPYHDELGRFTSASGAAVSQGQRRPASAHAAPTRGSAASRDYSAVSKRETGQDATPGPTITRPDGQVGTDSGRDPITGYSTDFMRDRVSSQTSHAETYFELNKRQADLNRWRTEKEANGEDVKRDLDDHQARLNADRARLDDFARKILDRETLEVLRAGLAPLDTAAGAYNVLSGDAELRDYLAVAGALPLGGTIGKAGKLAIGRRVVAEVAEGASREVVQLGGPFWKIKARKPQGYHTHHIPANSANGLRHGEGPAIAMRAEHHARTASHSSMPGSKAYLARQRELINQGKFKEAVEMDIQDIRAKFGNSYDGAIEQMLEYMKLKGY